MLEYIFEITQILCGYFISAALFLQYLLHAAGLNGLQLLSDGIPDTLLTLLSVLICDPAGYYMTYMAFMLAYTDERWKAELCRLFHLLGNLAGIEEASMTLLSDNGSMQERPAAVLSRPSVLSVPVSQLFTEFRWCIAAEACFAEARTDDIYDHPCTGYWDQRCEMTHGHDFQEFRKRVSKDVAVSWKWTTEAGPF